ncbi:MAG: ABC transporter ATP-binding protein [Eubacteriales bacterium]
MLKLFKNLDKSDFVLVAFIICLIFAQVYLDLALPDYMSEITKLVQTEGSAMEDIYQAGGKMLLCALGSLSIAVVVAVCAAKIAANFSFITRGKIFEKVMGFSMKEVNSFSTSSLITRTTNDITQIQTLIVMGMQMMIKAPLTAIWAIYKISNNNGTFTLATGIAMAILMAVVSVCLSLAIPRFRSLQTLTDNVNQVAKTRLDGLAVVRAYNAEAYEDEKFEVVNQDITSTNLFVGRTMSFLMPSIQSISSGLTLSFYLLGASLINQAAGMEKLTIFSDMVVFSSYAILIIMSFIMLCMVFMMYPRAAVAGKRINEVLDSTPTIQEGTKEDGLAGKKGEVEFKNVSFKYPDADDYVLKDISFTAKHGEIVAFIGSTGCGKSTVLNLVPRFYDVTQGEVLINGINVKQYKKTALNGLIGYVSQRATLFTGTVKSNVIFGDNEDNAHDEEHLENSLETAQAEEFVQSLDGQEDAAVAQGGGNFSGGQKQRISIARAIYRDPEIFIFDDSFSALDYKTDRKLRDTLNIECKESTRLIIGQRIGTIKDADKIVVLDCGRIVGMGKHFDLLENCEVYKQIALSQLSEEELSHG